ncbi:MAG: type II secretion system protein [Elusimicrobiaceae bacterium]|nr:type II secretion system protein [Elusimicrobiaceae bacterium]
MNKKAFTLIEMLTVIIIVGILSAVALPQYRKVVERSRFTKAQVMAKALYDSCERLVAEFGVEEFGALDSSVKKITRLDIGSTNLLPTGFSINDNTLTIVGVGFNYTLNNTGVCFVTITKTTGSYKDVNITYNGSVFTCSNNTEACDIYGL